MTVSAEQRAALARAVSGLRRIFETDYSALAEGKFGIHLAGRRAGEVEDATALSLSAHDVVARSELLGVVEYLQGEGLGAKEAVERMVREAVFTTVNRLLAIRVAESVGVLPPSLAEGNRSEGFAEAVAAFPLLRDADISGGYWVYLQICGDELSHAVPRLFDRRNPLSALVPSADALDGAIGILTDPGLAEVWTEPETLGWSYQFFNSQEERKAMREASAAPRDWRELAVRNQFFTPGYVVDFLVQNTLGRRLLESGFDLDLPFLLGEANTEASPTDLDDIAVLDPAVGSGNFLLGAYDLLERAWSQRGIPPADAAPSILGSLYGIDVDPRAAQVAQTALFLRARRSAPTGALPSASVVTARPLPKDPDAWETVLRTTPTVAHDIIGDLGDLLGRAPVLGSLMTPENFLTDAIGTRLERPRLGDEAVGSFDQLETLVLDAAERVAAAATASPAERLFAAETADALRTVELLARRYDVVLMNPPFGSPPVDTADFLKASYRAGATDLFAAFVERGQALLTSGGYCGALTSRNALFLITHEVWRREVVLPGLVCCLDLGLGVLQDALVEASAYVIGPTTRTGVSVFASCLEAEDKESAIATSLRNAHVVAKADLEAIPGAPFAYWVEPSIRSLFKDFPPLESDGVAVRKGGYSGDDFRRVRAWWEVGPEQVGRYEEWAPYAKGGSQIPYYAEPVVVAAWDEDRRTYKDFHGRPGRPSEIPDNVDFYFRPGLWWTRRTQAGFSARVLPSGFVLSDRSPAALADDEAVRWKVLGYLNSSIAWSAIRAMVGFASYEVGVLQRLPVPKIPERVGALAREAALAMRRLAASDETQMCFVSPLAAEKPRSEILAYVRQLATEIDELLIQENNLQLAIEGSTPSPTIEILDRLSRQSGISQDDLCSFLVGCAFGRWDALRSGATQSDDLDLFDSPATKTHGTSIPTGDAHRVDLVGPRSSSSPARDGVLHDDPYHSQDIVRAVEEAAEQFGIASGSSTSDLNPLTDAELRDYLRRDFFGVHLRRYSQSNRKAPIYWHLAVPSRQWGLWVYAQRLSREQLFAISRAAQEKLHRLSDQAAQLRRDLETAGDRSGRDRLETTEDLIRELGEFHERAEAVAQSGWEPDLNDGIILNAAPLEDLFADTKWRKDIEKHRHKLEQGAYPWASVQRNYFDRLNP